MQILVDTCIWSLAFRRQHPDSEHINRLRELISENRVRMIGPIRQELLSGIKEISQFNRLKQKLIAFPDLEINTHDYEQAAYFSNQLRKKGVQSTAVDNLICALAHRYQLTIYTTDKDFQHYKKVLPIHLLT